MEWNVGPWPHSNFVQPIFSTICFLISFCKRDHVRIRKITYHWQNAKCACQNQRNIRLTLEKEILQKKHHIYIDLHPNVILFGFQHYTWCYSFVSWFDFFNVGLKNVGLHVFYFWTKFNTTYLWVWFCASKNVKLRRWMGNILWRMFLELPAHWTKSKRKCVFSCIFGTCRDMCIHYVF